MAAPSQGQPTRSCSPPRPRHRARGAAAASASRQGAKHETPADQSPQRARRSRCRRRRAPCGPSAATNTRARTTTSADGCARTCRSYGAPLRDTKAPRLQCSRAVHHPAFEHGALPYQGAEGSPLHAAAHRSPARRRFRRRSPRRLGEAPQSVPAPMVPSSDRPYLTPPDDTRGPLATDTAPAPNPMRLSA